MTQLNREQVAARLGAYYSRHMTRNIGKPSEVRSYYDETKRAYCIHGELPHRDDGPYPELAAKGQTWTMIDYVKPSEARRLIATNN